MEHQSIIEKFRAGTNQPRESLKRDLIQGKSRRLQTSDGLHNQYQELRLELLSLRAFLHLEAAVAAATASTAATTTDSHFQKSGHSDNEAGWPPQQPPNMHFSRHQLCLPVTSSAEVGLCSVLPVRSHEHDITCTINVAFRFLTFS